MAKYELNDRTAIVTGAGAGIGEACAHVLSSSGAAVLVVDLDEDRAQSVASAISEDGGTAYRRQQRRHRRNVSADRRVRRGRLASSDVGQSRWRLLLHARGDRPYVPSRGWLYHQHVICAG